MKDVRGYIESGIIEAYVLGMASSEETKEVEELAVTYSEVQRAIDDFSELLEQQALANAVEPDPLVKPLLMATIDYMSRMEKGEAPADPPELHADSLVEDYAEWLNRHDMVLPDEFNGIHAKIVGYTPKITTIIVWIENMAPQEVHHDEYEKFLIVEGTCRITIAEDVYNLSPGDFLAIPLHKNHAVQVTSSIPCKVILQRVAA